MQKSAILFLTWVLYTLILALLWFFRSHSVVNVGVAVAGSLIGFLLPVLLDVLLPKIVSGSAKADTDFAKEVLQESAEQMRQGNIHSETAPVTPLRSYPLLFGYLLAAIFVISSTSSWFGRGFVLGLGLSLVLDLLLSRKPVEYLKARWFSVFHANLSEKEFDYFVWVSAGVFVILTILSAFV